MLVMNRTDLINRLIAHFGYTSYLEIGVFLGENFNAIRLSHNQKTGVDPESGVEGVFRVTSDEFFASNQRKFDIIFIDGLHHEEQVYRDINNALAVLSPGGAIVCHDISPSTYERQVVPRLQECWMGDCWKAWVRLRTERSDLEMKVVDADYGCGIIRQGLQELLDPPAELKWEGLQLNRVRWLNLISVAEFNRQYPSAISFGQTLQPVESSKPRPFWSVIVPIYERTKYLPQCLGSILSQAGDATDLEILVQDDCSSRDPAQLVANICGERAAYRRTTGRRGLYGNVNNALAHVSGQWVHILHEDDFVEAGFYKTMRRALEQQPQDVGMGCCQYTNFNETDRARWSPQPFRNGAGILENWVYQLAVQNPLNVAAVVHRRRVFETVGVFREDMPFTADWEYYVRSAVFYDWWYQPENLARFRVHPESQTTALSTQGRTAVDLRHTIATIERYLPEEVKQRVLPLARQLHGRNFLIQAWNAFQSGNIEAALLLMEECLRLGGPASESPEFAQVLQHPQAGPVRQELVRRWQDSEKTDAAAS